MSYTSSYDFFFLLYRAFPKFKEALRLIPAKIKHDSPLDATSARDLFPAIQPIHRYIKV